MSLKHLTTAVALAILSFSTCAADFSEYEGKDAIQEGMGGEKKTIDDVDFWSNGAPPRKFKLLGYLTDKRHKTGLVGKIRMSGLESSIAEEAKEVGGDAVILMSAEAETTGYVGQAQTTGHANTTFGGNTARTTGNSRTNLQAVAVQKQLTRYAVVKYLPEDDEAETVNAPKE